MPTAPISIDGRRLTLDEVVTVARDGTRVELDPLARPAIEASAAWVAEAAARGDEPVYGVNTGFGTFHDRRIEPHEVAALSYNLIVSHAAGVGAPLSEDSVRAVLLIRANTLARGHSGVRPALIEILLAMLNAGVCPVIPRRGSLSASGDLAPLSHMALVLSRPPAGPDDEKRSGEAFYGSERMSGLRAMHLAGIERIVLRAREGLALNNGTSAVLGLLCLLWHDTRQLLRHAEFALAMSMEALLGVMDAYHPRLHDLGGSSGQRAVAQRVASLLEGSSLVALAPRPGHVQDAYSLRCAPQVLGAVQDVIDCAADWLTGDINAVTDNPIILLESDRANKAFSGGNFHAQRAAFTADMLSLAVCEVASMAERRINRLLDPHTSHGLPPMLTGDRPGLHSGLMAAHYTAAALVSENRTLAHPDSVDSIPTSANQEDHVSMAMNGALHLEQVVGNAQTVVAIELLCAAQALELRLAAVDHGQLAPATRRALALIRQVVAPLRGDRLLSTDIEAVADLVRSARLLEAAGAGQ